MSFEFTIILLPTGLVMAISGANTSGTNWINIYAIITDKNKKAPRAYICLGVIEKEPCFGCLIRMP